MGFRGAGMHTFARGAAMETFAMVTRGAIRDMAGRPPTIRAVTVDMVQDNSSLREVGQ